MRIAFLKYGFMAYEDACYRALAELGNDLLLVYPEKMDGAPFEDRGFADYAERHVWHSDAGIWQGDPPPAEEMVPLLERFAPDVVLMVSWRGKGYRKAMAAQKGRALRVLFTSSVWEARPKQWLGRATHRWYLDPLFDCAFVPGDRSEWFARRLGFGADQIIRGANSADVDVFERGARTGQELAGRRQFLFTGRLVGHKSPDVLAAAYRRYRTLVPDPWDLAVIGLGPMADVFTGIEGVRMLGFVQPPELAAEMHRSSCLVFPSAIDFYGVVVHEATTAGLPVLCSDGVGAVPYLLQDGFNGWTVAAGNVEELAGAMARMSSVGPERLQAMSDGSRSLAQRLNPRIWATNFHEETQRRLHALRGAAAQA